MLTILSVMPDKHLKLLMQKSCKHSSLLDSWTIHLEILKLSILILKFLLYIFLEFDKAYSNNVVGLEKTSSETPNMSR